MAASRASRRSRDPAEALSNLGNCGIYVFEPEIFDYFPDRTFVDWAQDVFPALLERDMSFYGHGIAEYWNDIGSLEELRQGNFDALAGEVRVECRAGDRDESGADAEVEEPPVFIGEGCEIAAGVRLTGPVVIGERMRSARDAAMREGVAVARRRGRPRTSSDRRRRGRRGRWRRSL